MPHVTIEMLPGRSAEIKCNLAEKVAEVVADCVRVEASHVSVVIKDIEQKDWKETVDDRIMKEGLNLYRRPRPISESVSKK